MMKQKRKKRVWALLLSAALIVTQLPAVAMADNNTPEDTVIKDGSIASFEPLDSRAEDQTVDLGTALSELNLPDTVTASVYQVTEDLVSPDENGTEESGVSGNSAGASSKKESRETVRTVTTSREIITVAWSSEPAYDGDTAGKYVFTADAGGYVLSGAVKPPQLTVTVTGQTAESLTETSAEAPTEAPAETSTEAPTEAPAEISTEAPTETSTEDPTETPSAEPLPCTRTGGCILPEGHEGVCVTARSARAVNQTVTGSWDADNGELKITHVEGKLEEEIQTLLNGTAASAIQSLYITDGQALNAADYRFLRAECTSLYSLNDSTPLRDVPDGAFDNRADAANGGLNKLAHVYLYGGPITSIGANAFRECPNLVSVYSKEVKKLGEYAFSGCVSLESSPDLSLLEGPALAAGVFEGCRNLIGIRLPSSISRLESCSFRNVSNLVLTLEYDGVVAMAADSFQGASNLMVRVPGKRLAEYQADTDWGALLRSGVITISPYDTSAVDALGFLLSFADGTPQPGSHTYEGDYYCDTNSIYLHPQKDRELNISGGYGLNNVLVGTDSLALTSAGLRLTGNVAAIALHVGSYNGWVGQSSPFPVSLHLTGNGHTFKGKTLSVNQDSRITVAEGLTVDAAITLGPDSAFTASGPFSQTAGFIIRLDNNSLFELREQPSSLWLNRLTYSTLNNKYPDGQGRAVFSDGEFTVDKNGVTCVTPAPVVTAVSPAGSGAAVSGQIAITFSETMDTAAGSVTLMGSDGTRSLAGGSWNSPSNTIFTVDYSGLTHNLTYQVGISGFKSTAGFTMTDDDSHRFTTMDRLAVPVAAPPGGAYSAAQSVTLTCSSVKAEIRYTLDGSDPVTDPNHTRQIYTAPISVQPGSTLKAYAAAAGLADSEVLTEVYTKKSQSSRADTPAPQSREEDSSDTPAVLPQNSYTVTGDRISQAVSRSDLKKLADFGMNLTLRCDAAGMTFRPAALKAILAAVPATAGSVLFTAAPADVSASPDAAALTGARPVYDFTISYKNGSATITAVPVNFPAGSASIFLRYAPAATEATGSLFMVYTGGKGTATWLDKSSYHNGRVLAEVPHFSTYGVACKAPAPAFPDITSHWAKDDMEFAAARGLFTGTGDGLFSPDSVMTRGMFVTALGRLAGINPGDYKTRSFTDVKADSFHAAYAEWSVQKNIVNVTGDKLFAPDAPVTREQMAVIMANYAKRMGYSIPAPLAAVTFTDNDKIGAWAAKDVAAMQRAGIIRGKDGNRFDPQGNATRAEGSAALRRFVEIVIDPATAAGWVKNDDGRRLYYEGGRALTGWNTIGRLRYYFNADGIMHEGWKQDSTTNKWYYWTNEGAASGWMKIDGKWYFFDDSGAMAVNAKTDGNEAGRDGTAAEI